MRREGKEVQSFFFLVDEHISPGAGEGFKGLVGGTGEVTGVRGGGSRSGTEELI